MIWTLVTAGPPTQVRPNHYAGFSVPNLTTERSAWIEAPQGQHLDRVRLRCVRARKPASTACFLDIKLTPNSQLGCSLGCDLLVGEISKPLHRFRDFEITRIEADGKLLELWLHIDGEDLGAIAARPEAQLLSFEREKVSLPNNLRAVARALQRGLVEPVATVSATGKVQHLDHRLRECWGQAGTPAPCDSTLDAARHRWDVEKYQGEAQRVIEQAQANLPPCGRLEAADKKTVFRGRLSLRHRMCTLAGCGPAPCCNHCATGWRLTVVGPSSDRASYVFVHHPLLRTPEVMDCVRGVELDEPVQVIGRVMDGGATTLAPLGRHIEAASVCRYPATAPGPRRTGPPALLERKGRGR